MEDPNNPALGADGSPEAETFGQILPVSPQAAVPSEYDSPITFEDEPAALGNDQITFSDEGPQKPGLNLPLAKQKAAKMHFALGEKSPGVDVLTQIYASGTEDSLRQQLSREESAQQENLRNKIIQEKAAKGEPILPEDIAALAGLAKYVPKSNPETILERKYADTLVNSAQTLVGGPDSPISQGFRQDPERTAQSTDIAAILIARQEIVKNVLNDVEGIYQNQSWGGWLVDQAKSFVPLYGTAKLGWGEKRSESYLKGNVVEDMVRHFWRMPLDQMPSELRKYLFDIAKDNPSLAREVATAMLSHTSSSQFLDSAWTVFDVASVLPARTIGKALGTATEVATRAVKGSREGVEAVQGVAGRGVAREALPAASEAPRAADEALKAAVRANADEVPDMPRMLEVMGDTKKASEVTAMSRAQEIFTGGDASGQGKALARRVMGIFDPERIVTNAPDNVAAARSERLVEFLKAHAERISKTLTERVSIARAPEEAYAQAIRRESERLQEEVIRGGATNDAIVAVNWVRPEDTINNVSSISVSLGKTDGSLFNTVNEALQYGYQRYKLPPNVSDVEQVGQGFVLKVRKNIDETSSVFRETIKTEENTVKPTLWNNFIGWLRSADDRVSQLQRENRKAAVHTHSAVEAAMKDMIKDIGPLGKSEREEVFRVMRADKHEIDPAWKARYEGEEPPRGRFRDTEEDFNVAFMRTNGGKMPTESQTKAYFAYRQLNDWDWVLRNTNVYRDRARQGYQTIVLKDTVIHPQTNLAKPETNQFIGKLVDELPYGSDFDASVVIHNAGAESRRMKLHTIRSSAEQADEIKRLQAEGYKIVKVENPTRVPFEEKFGRDTVNFIITKDLNVAPLEYVQVPYRPGWHTEYAQPFFVKQPKGRRVGGDDNTPSRFIYEGDQAVFGFNTRAEANKYAINMEKARQLLKEGKLSELEAFLPRNLPWTRAEFSQLFEARPQSNGVVLPPLLDIDSPFKQVASGKYTTDLYGDALRKHYGNFEDTIRSPHNDFANVDKKFLGQRDNPLWTIKETGSELNPIYKADAEEIDVGLSLNRTMANIMRSSTFSDYKIAHVEGWIAQFGHLLRDNIELIRANPTYYIHHPNWVDHHGINSVELAAAKDSRRALIELLGTQSDLQLRWDSYMMKVMDSIYNLGGQGTSDFLSGLAAQRAKDPVSILRHSAFHLGIGLFNPYQLVQNAATMANAIAIAGPVNGFSGAAAILPMRWALHNENALEKISRNMTSYGWKPEWFKESYQELKRSGKWLIEGEHTWKDDISGPKLAQGKFGNLLDAGLVFFKEGERATRLAAWNAAYLEWRKVNPTAVIDDAVRRMLIDRSDLMSANMTRASNSAWQQGVFAIPAQFLSYHARLAEQMVGKRLTWQEKLRVVGVNSALYGLPIGITGSSGLGSLAGGMYPAHERIREEMLKRGIDMDDNRIQLLINGMVGILGKVIAGSGTDISARMGPGGGHLLKSIFEDEPFMKIVFGASGVKAGSIAESLDPVAKWVLSPFRAEEGKYPLKADDALAIIRNIKTVDNALAVYYAYNYGKAYAKNGQQLGDVTTREMLSQMFLGGGPQKISDMYLKQDILKDRGKMVQKVLDAASKDADAMMQATDRGDHETADVYRKRLAAHMHLGDLSVQERTRLFNTFYNKHKDKITTIDWNFIRQAPASQARQRLEGALN